MTRVLFAVAVTAFCVFVSTIFIGIGLWSYSYPPIGFFITLAASLSVAIGSTATGMFLYSDG